MRTRVCRCILSGDCVDHMPGYSEQDHEMPHAMAAWSPVQKLEHNTQAAVECPDHVGHELAFE